MTIDSRNDNAEAQPSGTAGEKPTSPKTPAAGASKPKQPAKEEENPEKEKNQEGKQIGGFIIGKTKGKGTFGKVK